MLQKFLSSGFANFSSYIYLCPLRCLLPVINALNYSEENSIDTFQQKGNEYFFSYLSKAWIWGDFEYIFYRFISRVCFSILVISIESSGVWCVEEFKLRYICDVNFQWHLLLFTFYYCQCFSNFECQSINLFQVLNWYILTFDNKCAQKQFYCEIYVICKIQTIFNIDSFVLFVIQTEVLCQIMKRFLIYLFLQNTTQKQTQSFLFYVVEKKIHPPILMIYLSSAVAACGL